jgi:hypothetical protein
MVSNISSYVGDGVPMLILNVDAALRTRESTANRDVATMTE